MNRTDLDYVSVVERTPESAAIDRELRLLDPRLFLNPERDPDFQGRIVWSVCYHMGAGQPPLHITDWRDPDTREPLPLSWGLWSKVKAREHRDPFTLRDDIRDHNERLRTRRLETQRVAYDEVVSDVARFASDKRSGLLFRGQSLRRARDRQRAKGRVR